jgi:tetratricopeptide (TPR) repeat protein
MNPQRPDKNLPAERTEPPFPGRWQRWWAKISAFDLRDRWWRLLDALEERRALRRWLYALVFLVVASVATWHWGSPWWYKRTALSVTRQWIDAGRLDNAAESLQRAVTLAPEQPETWHLAAELARLRGRKAEAVQHARKAAMLDADNPDRTITWAVEAMWAELPEEAGTALAKLSPEQLSRSPHAQRILGEIARRAVRLTEAKTHFENALRLDGPVAIDEVPLGLILLNATDPAERQRGINFLSHWSTDKEWGAVALRTLLGDAQSRKDKPAMLRWATALQAHPGCTLADMPNWLLALAQSDEARFAEAVALLEKNHAVSPPAAAQLIGWLNQIGRSNEAARWMKTLPPTGLLAPPLAVVGAEALRASADWPGLKELVTDKNWGHEVEFLRWMYGLEAALALGDDATAKALWNTLYSHAQLDGVHALFAGSTLFSWGRTEQAEALWWRAAEQEGPNAIEAFGSLARFYQTRREAEGQYRVFRRLHSLRPKDAAIGNNFAFFAALTNREEHLAEKIARENLTQEPLNRIYLGTLAFVLVAQNRPEEALTLLKPAVAETEKNPALTFAYGLALAGAGKKAEAKVLLATLPTDTLTIRAEEVIKAALRDY